MKADQIPEKQYKSHILIKIIHPIKIFLIFGSFGIINVKLVTFGAGWPMIKIKADLLFAGTYLFKLHWVIIHETKMALLVAAAAAWCYST